MIGLIKVVYVLWSFSIADMSPQPMVLAEYGSLEDCKSEAKHLKSDTWHWRFSCVKTYNKDGK